MTVAPRQTIPWAPWIWGDDAVALDDPAETFHEASRLYPHVSTPACGATLLAQDEGLRASTGRASKRTAAGGGLRLPASAPAALPWDDVVALRRSQRHFSREAVPLPVAAAVLRDAYGVTHAHDGTPLRSVPSGGALYPLELYVAAAAVGAVEPGVYHFDPLREALDPLTVGSTAERMSELSPYGDVLAAAAFVVVISAMFWRTRFKYGLRGYRFALIEAGHVGQNLVLAAAAHGLAAVPIGGFYDRRADALVDADGLDEAVVYAVALGCPA